MSLVRLNAFISKEQKKKLGVLSKKNHSSESYLVRQAISKVFKVN